MADEKKPKRPRGRLSKAAVASSSKQRTLKDMFGGGASHTPPSMTTLQEAQPLIELLESSDTEMLPSTSEGAGLRRQDGVVYANGSPNVVALAPQAPPKKLYSMFERREESKSVQPDITSNTADEDVIHITNDASSGSCSPALAMPQAGSQPEGSSRDDPIVVVDTPARVRPLNPASQHRDPPAKAAWTIFSKKSVQQNLPSLKTTTALLPVLYPDAQSQHVREPQTIFPDPGPIFTRSDKGEQPASSSSVVIESENKKFLRQLCRDNLIPATYYTVSSPCLPLSPCDQNSYIDTIPRSHQAHPAISRLLQSVEVDSADISCHFEQKQWTDRWRPRRAEEVLGNEQHSLYLRDWLVALRLQAETMRPPEKTKGQDSKGKNKRKRKVAKQKRPDIVRHVKKRRRTDDLEENFMASDFTNTDEEEITARSSDTDDFAFCQEMVNRRNPSSSATDEDRPSSPSLGTIPEDDLATLRSTYRPTRFGKQIGSTILLTGPSGAGKTASVYACAEELGWEVFEVYPGIGERSGGDLNRLIGDVGKNHLVKVHHQPSPKMSKSKAGIFQTEKGRGKASRRVVESDDESEEVDIESTVQFPPLLNEEDVQPTEPTVNQSVILIEEVDILYSSDTNFWPALISIIHECRRPVVLTCNDISLVPYKDLPLQATLQFQPCTTGLASSFLQALCLAEGVKVEREALERAYINSHLRDPPYLPDLRHTIIQLQFWLTGGNKSDVVTGGPNASSSSPTGPGLMLAVEDSSNAASTNVEKGIPGILRQLAKKSDFLSGLDSELSRDANGTLRDLSTYEFIPPSDEQLGYAVLPTDTDTDHIPVSTYYYQDENLMAAGLELSKRAHGDIRPDDMPNAQHDDRAVSLARLGPLLRRLRPWRESANDAALYLDYAPWIRYIVAADDVAEAGISEVGSQSRRSTKNSQKTSEVRWLKLEPEERDVLRNTALRIEDPSAGWKE